MSELETRISDALCGHVSPLIARSLIGYVHEHQGTADLAECDPRAVQETLDRSIRAFVSDPADRDACLQEVHAALGGAAAPSTPGAPVVSTAPAVTPSAEPAGSDRVVVKIDGEFDIVTARGQGRQLCEAIGFPASQQIKVATVVSELARNIVKYAGVGTITLTALSNLKPGIEIVARDDGPGIPDLEHVLSGSYKSRTGMGMGLIGTRNLMDEFDVTTGPACGTTVRARKYMACDE